MVAGTELTLGGWVFMLVSCGAATVLTVWCFVRVLWPSDDDVPPREDDP